MGVRPFGTGPSRPPSLFLSNLFLCRFYTDRTSDGDIGRADRTSVGRMDDHNGNAVDWACMREAAAVAAIRLFPWETEE